jgi:phosphatidate cytidylyltransferase
MALLIHELAGLSLAATGIAGVVISLCALTGDLGASWVKRGAGLKDYSSLLLGQGGMLDRFDSFICAGGGLAPVLLLLANR